MSLATAGLFLPNLGMFVTGHSDGSLYYFNIKNKKTEHKFRISGHRITSIVISPSNQVLVTSATGAIVEFPIDKPESRNIIGNPTHDKVDRVWRAGWSSDDKFYVGMNYGSLKRGKRTKGHFILTSISGHSNAIFGLDSSYDGIIVSGDYRGHITLRTPEQDQLPLQEFGTASGVQGVSCNGISQFAVVTKHSGVYYFETESAETSVNFHRVLRIDLARGKGECVTLSPNGRMLFAGTDEELVFYDLTKNLGVAVHSDSCVKLWATEDMLYVLTSKEIVRYVLKDIVYPPQYIPIKHVKVSLLGHTYAGKSSLCERVIHGFVSEKKRTYGKQIWTWKPEEGQGKIIFFDHGGQEAVIGTFIPFLKDSDIVLLLYKRTEYLSLQNALKILDSLKESLSATTPILVVETHLDDMDATMADSTLEQLEQDGIISDYARVSSTDGIGIDDFVNKLLGLVDWDQAKGIIETEHSRNLRTLIEELRIQKVPTMKIKELKKKYHDRFDETITVHHLRFLLTGLSSEGLIEYYPEVVDTVVINDDEFNKLWSSILIFTKSKDGITSLPDLKKRFANLTDYVSIIDRVFVSHGICIEKGDLRVFPELLSDKFPILENEMVELLEEGSMPETWKFHLKRNYQRNLIQALFDLNLLCISVTKTNGVFAWKRNAILHYIAEHKTNPFGDKERLLISWRVGGVDKKAIKRLILRFQKVLELVLGTPVETPLLKRINAGENIHLEFKSSLRYDYDKKSTSKRLEYVVARAAAGMINAEGGSVLIGVDDAGYPIGLVKDFNTLGKKNNRDGFELHLTQVLDYYIGKEYTANFHIRFNEVLGTEICELDMKSAHGPVFIKRREGGRLDSHFVVRIGNSTHELNPEQYEEYKSNHWK